MIQYIELIGNLGTRKGQLYLNIQRFVFAFDNQLSLCLQALKTLKKSMRFINAQINAFFSQ